MKRLYRDRFDQKIAGIFGGLGQYLQIDSTLLRIIGIILLFITAGGIGLAYLVLWYLLPLGPRSYIQANYKRLYRSRRDRKISGICGGLGEYFRIDSNIIRFVVVIALFATAVFPVCIAYIIGTFIIKESPT